MQRKTHKVLGYDVDLMSFKEALEFVETKINKDEGLHVVTINPEIIIFFIVLLLDYMVFLNYCQVFTIA